MIAESVKRVLKENDEELAFDNIIKNNNSSSFSFRSMDEFFEWFKNYAKLGWTIKVSQEGINDNRAFNLYDDKGNALGSFDENDGWENDSIY